jgi:hypothetical protein
MAKAGDVLSHKQWVFDDGSEAPKLLVVLNTQTDIDMPCLVLKTTSNPKWYAGVKVGCNQNKKVFFVLKANEPCLDLDTYIQLPSIWELTTKELLDGWASKAIRPIGSVSGNCLAQLKNCLKNYKDDISTKHRRLIF